MAATVLIVATWLSGLAPAVTMQPFDTAEACVHALDAVSGMLQAQARSNMTGPHARLAIVDDPATQSTLLRTPIGREVARLRCVAPGPGPEPAPHKAPP